MIAIVQAVVAVIGFYIFGLPYPFLGGLAAGILSLFPVVGPYFLYIPIGAALILQDNIGAGLGIMAYGLIAGSLLDYIFRPYYIGKRANIHPLIIFFGIFGGIEVFGLPGLFIGPIIISIAVSLFKELQLSKVSIK